MDNDAQDERGPKDPRTSADDFVRQGTDVARQVGDVLNREIPAAAEKAGELMSKVDFDGIASSIERAAAAVAAQLGMAEVDSSPYVVCRHGDEKVRAKDLIGGIILGYLAIMMIVPTIMMAFDGLVSFLVGLAVLVGLGTGAVKSFAKGARRRKIARLCLALSKAVGDETSMRLRDLGGRVELTVKELQPLLQEAISRGLIPQGHIASLGDGTTLYLTDGSYKRARKEWNRRKESQKGSQGEKAKSVDDGLTPEIRELLGVFSDFGRMVEESRARIVDEGLRSSLESIVVRTQQLSSYLRSHPECASQLRRVANYYLPQTSKLAASYAELEQSGSGGAGVESVRAELAQTLQMVDEGLSRTLDNLLQEQSMDLTGDLKVMRTMLEQDGLTSTGDELRP
ncbi:5-bromo-4-chloroindolyl phosphate hydrolysis family protein [Olsenella sp. DNF00959]|uniref:5-bromo-4-chloroindolyl phosphate hydrolysis family protein n=1 Tax=Olsenella sp. DNF00959 TaxID=1476999 RepID=UPI000784FBD6|nr:5-bromo-4-chloroindolyl phosphate hydrolysis family protein [Olsenella sp. DNF00959]